MIPVDQQAYVLGIVGAYTKDLHGTRRDAALSFIAKRIDPANLRGNRDLRPLCGAARKIALSMPQPVPPGTSDPRNWFADRRERPATLEQAISLAKRSAIQW